MSEFGNVAFDPETLAILEGVFDEAWASIQAQRNGNITRAALVDRILNLRLRESAILRGYLMARLPNATERRLNRTVPRKRTRSATALNRRLKRVSGKLS